jgi:hypothetical protein
MYFQILVFSFYYDSLCNSNTGLNKSGHCVHFKGKIGIFKELLLSFQLNEGSFLPYHILDQHLFDRINMKMRSYLYIDHNPCLIIGLNMLA